MTDREQFDAWWESLPLTERIIACHPVNAASHFAYKGWQAARAAPAQPHDHAHGAPLRHDCTTWCQIKHDEFTRSLERTLQEAAPAHPGHPANNPTMQKWWNEAPAQPEERIKLGL